jgi:hypothetical protein
VQRLRLIRVAERAVLQVFTADGHAVSLHADDGTRVRVDAPLALRVAAGYGGGTPPRLADAVDYDQWSVHHRWNPWRPFLRIRLDDTRGRELYVSSVTGEVIRDTTRAERIAGWLGAVPHWIYPTALRRHPETWRQTVIWVSAAGIVGTLTGIALGVIRLRRRGGWGSPFRRWHWLHHVAGLGCALFLLTWIFSGFLSVNPGHWFSDPSLHRAAMLAYTGALRPGAFALPADALRFTLARDDVREMEWLRVGDVPLIRVRGARDLIFPADGSAAPTPTTALDSAMIMRAARASLPEHTLITIDHLTAFDAYYYGPVTAPPPLPVLRARFEDGTWLHIDPASGAVLDRSDASRRLYRWLFDGLHRLDPPILLARPALRSTLVVTLCAAGFVFSVTSVVLGWRRLKRLLG